MVEFVTAHWQMILIVLVVLVFVGKIIRMITSLGAKLVLVVMVAIVLIFGYQHFNGQEPHIPSFKEFMSAIDK